MTAHNAATDQVPIWTKLARSREGIACMIAGAVLPFVPPASDLIQGPQRDVADWLKIQPIELAHCTLMIQILFAINTAVGLMMVVGTATNSGMPRKTKLLLLGAYVLLLAYVEAVVVFSVPSEMLAIKTAWPADTAASVGVDTPAPFRTDFDYIAFQNQLWPAVIAPAGWGAVIGILGGAAAVCWKRATRKAQSVNSPRCMA